ncbi:hypothetical protein EC973_005306, partial [Apophysomyces ossiformis]
MAIDHTENMNISSIRNCRAYELYRAEHGLDIANAYPISVDEIRIYLKHKSKRNTGKSLGWIITSLKGHPTHGNKWNEAVRKDPIVSEILQKAKERDIIQKSLMGTASRKLLPQTPMPKTARKIPLVLPSENDPAVQGNWTCKVIQNGSQARGFVVMSTAINNSQTTDFRGAAMISKRSADKNAQDSIENHQGTKENLIADHSMDTASSPAPERFNCLPIKALSEARESYVRIALPSLQETQRKKLMLSWGLRWKVS